MISQGQLSQLLGAESSVEYQELRLAANTILQLLQHLEDQEETIELSTTQFDTPNWAYKQANINGAKRAYKRLRSYLTQES